jgi:hypothetical protein
MKLLTAVIIAMFLATLAFAQTATIPPSSSIVDATGNTWIVVAGVVYVQAPQPKPQTAGYSAGVTQLSLCNGVIWQQAHGGYWQWTGSAWSPANATGAPSTPCTTPPPAKFGIKNTGGKFTDLNGNPYPLISESFSGTETMQGGGVRAAGIANISQANWDAARTKWNQAAGFNVYTQPTAIRVPIDSAYWLGVCGTDLNLGGGWYNSGCPVVSANVYQGYITQEVARATAAGFAVIIDLHVDSIVTTAGQRFVPYGQTCFPSGDAPALWASVANTFKENPAVLFEAFNEPAGSNVYNAGANGGNQAYGWYSTGAATAPGPDAIAYARANASSWGPAPAYAANGTPAGCLMQNNNNGNAMVSGSAGQAIVLTGQQQIINTIRATGATNLILVSPIGWAGGIQVWLQAGLTDPLNQLGAVWHAYGGGNYAAMQAINAAGFPVIIDEADGGDWAAAGLNYTKIYNSSEGWGYCCAWTNWASLSDASPAFNVQPWNSLGMPQPNGSN